MLLPCNLGTDSWTRTVLPFPSCVLELTPWSLLISTPSSVDLGLGANAPVVALPLDGSVLQESKVPLRGLWPFKSSHIHSTKDTGGRSWGKNLTAQQGNVIFLTTYGISIYQPDATTKLQLFRNLSVSLYQSSLPFSWAPANPRELLSSLSWIYILPVSCQLLLCHSCKS